MAGHSHSLSSACEEVRRRLASPVVARRLGQALWMMAGEPFSQSDLLWARSTLGDEGDVLLWNALVEASCFSPDGQLRVRDLSRFLCFLLEDEKAEPPESGLVWTLPGPSLTVPGVADDGYARAVREVVDSSQASLTIVSPYLEAGGVGLLEDAVIEALHRGVQVTLVTHEAEDLASMASVALRNLLAEARNRTGKLAVYTAPADGVLLHLKVVVADQRRGVLGSANLTGKGLAGNLEAGTLVGPADAAEICYVVRRTIAAGLATRVFST